MTTPREVIDRLIKNNKPQRMGLTELIWGDTQKQWVAQGFPADAQGNPTDPCDHFKFDMDNAGDWFDILPIRGYEVIEQETDEWQVKRNGGGAALKYWKSKSGTPEHIDFRMTNRAIWEKDYRPHLLQLDPQRIKIDHCKQRLKNHREKGIWAFYGHMFVFENMRQSMGDICLYESVLLDPEWVHDYNRVYTDFFKAHYKYIFEQAGVPDGIWVYEDLGYRGTTFCSPKIYQELFYPYYRELLEFFHSYNLPVILHSCGYIEEIIPDIIDVGFVGLNPMEVKAGCDIMRIAEKYSDKLMLVGGLDIRILESGDQALIRKEVTKLVKGLKERGARFVFASDHSVSTSVKYQDYKLAVDVYREHMYY